MRRRRLALANILQEGVGLFLGSDATGRKIEMLDQGWGLWWCEQASTITLMSASLNNKHEIIHTL